MNLLDFLGFLEFSWLRNPNMLHASSAAVLAGLSVDEQGYERRLPRAQELGGCW
jgi:hypothetical protein